MLSRIDGIPNLIPTTNHKKIFFIGFLVLLLSYFVNCSQDSSKHIKSSQQIISSPLDEGNKNVLRSISGPSSYGNELSIKNDQIKEHAGKQDFLDSMKATPLATDKKGITALSSGKLPKEIDNKTINKGNLTSILQELPEGTSVDNGSGNGPDHIENDATIHRLKEFILGYVQDSLSNRSSEIFSGIRIETSDNESLGQTGQRSGNETAHIKTSTGLNDDVEQEFRNFLDGHSVNINLPRAVETGRLFFFKGLKKFLWPVFIGIQIAKTFLLALFLPSILGSLGKMLGKGLSSVSGFNHQSEAVNDLDFKDDTYNFDQDNSKYNDYAYQQQPEASTNHFATQMYDATALNNNALSRFGFGDQKLTYVNTGGGMYKDSNANGLSSKNNFKIFQDIPASSLLLSNYDPFYSPLLSRLDAVFQQLGLGQGNEPCREKLICLMYSNPAKYAPYSNLVSAQLSRELNELRKPTSDNPDILRFFKYMRAAKDGQDGEKCEEAYSSCDSFKESENPAMLTTYQDINKLVHARKFDSK